MPPKPPFPSASRASNCPLPPLLISPYPCTFFPRNLHDHPLWCLLGFVAWVVLILIVGIGAVRVGAVLAGKARPNAFPSDVPHGSEGYRRTMRAHANCVENLPLFASLVLTASVLQVQTPLLDTLSVVFLTARIAQSVTHISSGRSLAVNIRFTFFVVQLTCYGFMLREIIRHA